MKKNKISIMIILLFIIFLFSTFSIMFLNIHLMHLKSNKDIILAREVTPNDQEPTSARFVGPLEIDESYSNVTYCDSIENVGKGYVTNTSGTKRVIGCAYREKSTRIPTVNCNTGYSSVKISGRDKENNNNIVTLYVCQKIKYEYFAPIDANMVDVTKCDTSNNLYLGKRKIYNSDNTLSVMGCVYNNTVDVNVSCPNNSEVVLYNGFSKIDNTAVAVYACRQKETQNNNTGTITTPSTTTPNNDSSTNNGGGKDTGTTIIEDGEPRLDYDNVCASEGFMTASKIIGTIILIAKWLGPLILIIMGMIDFFKAVISSDDKALGDATTTFIKRMVIAIIIPIIPGLLYYLVDFLIGDEINNVEIEFGDCTKCLRNPLGKDESGKKVCDIQLYDYDNQRGEKIEQENSE